MTFDEWSANWSIDSKPELRDFARNVWDAAMKEAGWHPIEECPEELKDGRRLLMKGDPDIEGEFLGRWTKMTAHSGWQISGQLQFTMLFVHPTHYMEIPNGE